VNKNTCGVIFFVTALVSMHLNVFPVEVAQVEQQADRFPQSGDAEVHQLELLALDQLRLPVAW